MNFKIKFNVPRKDFASSTGKSTFSEHILNTGHQMRSMGETVTILHFVNDLKKMNTLEEVEIIEATTFAHMFNIMQNNNQLHQIQLQDQTATSMTHTEEANVQNFRKEPEKVTFYFILFQLTLPRWTL
jgi:hypothetical protein